MRHIEARVPSSDTRFFKYNAAQKYTIKINKLKNIYSYNTCYSISSPFRRGRERIVDFRFSWCEEYRYAWNISPSGPITYPQTYPTYPSYTLPLTSTHRSYRSLHSPLHPIALPGSGVDDFYIYKSADKFQCNAFQFQYIHISYTPNAKCVAAQVQWYHRQIWTMDWSRNVHIAQTTH